MSIRGPIFPPKLHNFFYLAIHGGQRIGHWWSKISGYEDRQTCAYCNLPDTMDDILTQCTKPGQLIAWNLARTLWEKKTSLPWLNPSLGLILGCGLVRLQCPGDHNRLLDRFYCILVSETAFFIWKLRCETLLSKNDTPATATEIHNRWVHTLNERLTLDRLLTNMQTAGHRAVHPKLFAQTWHGALLDEDHLPEDWITKRETKVLVGIEPIRGTPPTQPYQASHFNIDDFG